MNKTLIYILGIPLTLTIIAYLSVSTYHILEKDRVFRECVKDINYLGTVLEFVGNSDTIFGGKKAEFKLIPNCLQVLGQ